jgi:DNA invertase Pin-like site-specific DNA recombinase
MNSTISEQHLSRTAYVYVRQSTLAQVRHHQESTERQYALRQKALELGWREPSVQILDRDLGKSGAQITGREDFKTLVAEVSMGQVGAVFALEVSRLARSNLDWHRLLELCALTGTLVIDEDGCYNPADFNDGLLLGLKGTMAQAELHLLRGRLLGGKLNKARKGELRFPKRSYGGAWDGKLIWGRLTHGRVLSMLKNPAYAGMYVFGRYQYHRQIRPSGEVHQRMRRVPMADWRVRLEEHHEGYIGWDEYLKNQERLEKNRTNGGEMMLSGPAREGLALLQGLLLCSHCGRALTVRYMGNGGIYPCYLCNRLRRDGLARKDCVNFRSDLLDDAVAEEVLKALEPAQLELALAALEELEAHDQTIGRQWQMRLERAEYEAALAERRYLEVDPSQRLVAATLERRWNAALLQWEELKKQAAQFRQQQARVATPEQKAKVLALAKDLPRLWHAPTTQAKDRKQMLRLLIKDITVEKSSVPKHLLAHIRWQGNACSDLTVQLPPSMADRMRYPAEVVDRVREMARQLPDAAIAERFRQEGYSSATGKPYSTTIIRWIRFRYRIPSPALRRPEELTVAQVAKHFGVRPGVVYYWIERTHLQARRVNAGSPYWIVLNETDKQKLQAWVQNSNRIHIASPKRTGEGAL